MVLLPFVSVFLLAVICALFNDDGKLFRTLFVLVFVGIILGEVNLGGKLKKLRSSDNEE